MKKMCYNIISKNYFQSTTKEIQISSSENREENGVKMKKKNLAMNRSRMVNEVLIFMVSLSQIT